MKSIYLVLALGMAAIGCATGKPLSSEESSPVRNRTLYQFTQKSGPLGWSIEDDVVMGGRSQGRLFINEAGNAVFSGRISLANDGGFSSVQADLPSIDVNNYQAVKLGLKGDGKRYQLRVDAQPDAYHSYVSDFQTSGDWEVVTIPFADMHAIRHGDRLDLPNYPGQTLARLQILIGNAREETFQLEIDRIWLE